MPLFGVCFLFHPPSLLKNQLGESLEQIIPSSSREQFTKQTWGGAGLIIDVAASQTETESANQFIQFMTVEV